jgi:hypothetical protein
MGSTLSFEYKEAIRCLQLIVGGVSHKKILLTIDTAMTSQQIALENNLAVSCAYNKKYDAGD